MEPFYVCDFFTLISSVPVDWSEGSTTLFHIYSYFLTYRLYNIYSYFFILSLNGFLRCKSPSPKLISVLHSLRVGWRNLPTLRVGWRNFFSSGAVFGSGRK